MRAIARNVEEEQRRLWRDYAERLQGLAGEEYDRAEAAAWEDLERALGELGVRPATTDDESV